MRRSKIDYMQIGQRLRLCRETQGYSRARLALKSGLNVETIHRCERGLSNLSLSSAVALCDALNLSLDEFVGR